MWVRAHGWQARLAVVLGAAAALLCPGAPEANADTSIELTGSGTATLDGILFSGEWDNAAKVDFNANMPAALGGGTTPASLYLMNDTTNLYSALRIRAPGVVNVTYWIYFPNTVAGDVLTPQAGLQWNGLYAFLGDQYYLPGGYRGDQVDGGTTDGGIAATFDGTWWCLEMSHPLDSADDSHDFRLAAGDVTRFFFALMLRSDPLGAGTGTYLYMQPPIAYLLISPGVPPNTPPVANAGADVDVRDDDGTGAETVLLDGSASYDPDEDGSIESWVWTWTENGTAMSTSGATASVAFPIGTRTVTLTVTDDAGATATDSLVVAVQQLDPANSVGKLKDSLGGLGLEKGLLNSLQAKLDGAAKKIADGKSDVAANNLDAFINEVQAQRGKKIGTAAADELIRWAQAIQAVLQGG